jgi:hypothetical protein
MISHSALLDNPEAAEFVHLRWRDDIGKFDFITKKYQRQHGTLVCPVKGLPVLFSVHCCSSCHPSPPLWESLSVRIHRCTHSADIMSGTSYRGHVFGPTLIHSTSCGYTLRNSRPIRCASPRVLLSTTLGSPTKRLYFVYVGAQMLLKGIYVIAIGRLGYLVLSLTPMWAPSPIGNSHLPAHLCKYQ